MIRHRFTLLLVSAAFVATPCFGTAVTHLAHVQQKQTPIYFETLAGRPFPYPLVHVTIAGKPSVMILDSGSTDIVLSRSVVNRLGLTVSSNHGKGTDAAGRGVSVAELSVPDIAIAGWGQLTHVRVLVTPLPKAFDTLGIAGVLSPQRLAEPGDSTVVDFSSNQVTVLPDAQALAMLGNKPRLKPSPIVCSKGSGAQLYGVQANVNGLKVPLMFDTGASSTGIDAGSRAGKHLINQSQRGAKTILAASGPMQTRVLPAARLRVGRTAKTLDVQLVPGSHKPDSCFDGALAMDFLRQCTLVLGSKSATAACR